MGTWGSLFTHKYITSTTFGEFTTRIVRKAIVYKQGEAHIDRATRSMASFLTILAGVVTLIAVGIYFFGIPPELKRKMERAALQTMGENKASYLVKENLQDAGFGSGEREGCEEGVE